MERNFNERDFNMKDIYTVVILEESGGYLTTASFISFDDAVKYCMNEMKSDDNDLTEDEFMVVQSQLEDEMYYDDYGTKYYIEEANLIG